MTSSGKERLQCQWFTNPSLPRPRQTTKPTSGPSWLRHATCPPPGSWTSEASAVDPDGIPCDPQAPEATRFCLVGALGAVGGLDASQRARILHLFEVAGQVVSQSRFAVACGMSNKHERYGAMQMGTEFPSRGFVFWPVGNGDSTTIVVDDETIVQLDLNHRDDAETDADPHAPIIDRLVERLPVLGGKRYLAAFGLTHADADHCRGFKRLLEEEDVLIGDLWFSPRILWERDELTDDAKAFCDEAERRIGVNRRGAATSGDRIRVIGDADILAEYDDLPSECFTKPGEWFSEIDGEDREGEFHSFVHAPYREDAERERNATSVALKVTLYDSDAAGRVIMFGDLHHETLERIFDSDDADSLEWNVFLAPHHCSDSAMFVEPESGGERELDSKIMAAFEAAGSSPTYIVSSSEPIPASNDPGDNPPHARAKTEYEKICERFECTGEWPSQTQPEPLVFHFVDGAFGVRDSTSAAKRALTAATATARGDTQTPGQRHGYGRRLS
jgi:hypothetical protein